MMYLAHNIAIVKTNSNYNTPSEIMDCYDLTFDGVYRNVWQNKKLLKNKNVILFVIGDYVGKNNYRLNPNMPIELFCDWNEIMELVTDGAKLGWHSWSHKDLTSLSDEELEKEVTPPFPMPYFAYPYGKFDERVVAAVKKAGYKEAFSVTEGDDSEFQRLRNYINL